MLAFVTVRFIFNSPLFLDVVMDCFLPPLVQGPLALLFLGSGLRCRRGLFHLPPRISTSSSTSFQGSHDNSAATRGLSPEVPDFGRFALEWAFLAETQLFADMRYAVRAHRRPRDAAQGIWLEDLLGDDLDLNIQVL